MCLNQFNFLFTFTFYLLLLLRDKLDQGIYIWNRESGELLEIIKSHEACVNCVAWNPVFNEFVSCSDDRTVRVWGCDDQ